MEKKKDVVIRVRVTKELNDKWQEVTKRNAVNGSELLRQFVQQKIEELEKHGV